MPFTVLETLNWPGGGLNGSEKKVTGDDRFGFDEAAGKAWVLDGATDLGPYRLFRKEESDAAWVAEAFNRALMAKAGETVTELKTWFAGIIETVHTAAKKASKHDLEKADRSTWPIASGMWMQLTGDLAVFVRFGDCIALIRTPDGQTEVLEHAEQANRETETSRKLNAMTPEEKIAGLREIRAQQNTLPHYPVLGMRTEAVEGMSIESRTLPSGSHVLLMSDGLWRVVDVYQIMSAAEMMDTVIENGIEALAKDMRAFERTAAQDKSVRIKASDDACGVLLRI